MHAESIRNRSHNGGQPLTQHPVRLRSHLAYGVPDMVKMMAPSESLRECSPTPHSPDGLGIGRQGPRRSRGMGVLCAGLAYSSQGRSQRARECPPGIEGSAATLTSTDVREGSAQRRGLLVPCAASMEEEAQMGATGESPDRSIRCAGVGSTCSTLLKALCDGLAAARPGPNAHADARH